MGMYTELVVNIDLKPETPQEILEVLQFMCEGLPAPRVIPEHPLFNTGRWEHMFCCSSPYHPGLTFRKLQVFYADDLNTIFNIALSVRSSFKNYDDEINLFFDFIKPYVDKEDGLSTFLGYSRYEEAHSPTLYFLTVDDKIRRTGTKCPD